MQDIIYKLVPGLEENELKREIEFYEKRGLPCPKLQNVNSKESKDVYNFNSNEQPAHKDESGDYHRSDEQVNVSLETQNVCQFKQIKRRFIRCSSHATVTHLKKYVAKKLFKSFDKYKDIDILCNNELLGKDHTLKFVLITKWRHKVSLDFELSNFPFEFSIRQRSFFVIRNSVIETLGSTSLL